MKLSISLLVVIFAVSCQASLEENGSCQGHCGTNLDSSRSCQCNRHCTRFNDCCADYQEICHSHQQGTDGEEHQGKGNANSCKSVSQVAQELWDNDVNRMSASDFSVNWQEHIPDRTTEDHAPAKFFNSVNEEKFNSPTYRTLIALLGNFNPTKGVRENVTREEVGEDNAFLDAILETSVIKSLESYLTCTNKIESQADLKQLLTRVWFGMFSRSSALNVVDTCGFEHVFVGEYKSNTVVNGFHNWISFYRQEKIGNLNYYGYVSKEMIEGNVGAVGLAFNWNGHIKTKGSFFLGVSPEFDIAIYTLCFVNRNCSFSIKSKHFSIKSFAENGHLSTAYVQ